MDKFQIVGGKVLSGEVTISGAKNAALPILLATMLTQEPVTLHNVPDLRDVQTCLKLLTMMGKSYERLSDNSYRITGKVTSNVATYELVKTMRASILALGPLTAYLGSAEVSLPGGCAIGARPVDLHVKGLKELGALFELSDGYIRSSTPDGKLHGGTILMDKVSVTGTENLMMAAALAEGTSVIENAAREPEIVDLAIFLRAMGAQVSGEGSDRIVIEGVPSLHGCEHSIVADRIETGTYLVAAMASHGQVTCLHALPQTLEPVIAKLRQARPNIYVSTDIIVGFPGETDEDFNETMRLVDDIKFDTSFSFIYSKRPGTPAAEMPDDVPMEHKREHLYTLQARLEEYATQYSQGMYGTRQRVLVEGISRKNEHELKGRASNNRIVVFEGDQSLIGSMVDVDITKVMSHTLKGQLI